MLTKILLLQNTGLFAFFGLINQALCDAYLRDSQGLIDMELWQFIFLQQSSSPSEMDMLYCTKAIALIGHLKVSPTCYVQLHVQLCYFDIIKD